MSLGGNNIDLFTILICGWDVPIIESYKIDRRSICIYKYCYFIGRVLLYAITLVDEDNIKESRGTGDE